MSGSCCGCVAQAGTLPPAGLRPGVPAAQLGRLRWRSRRGMAEVESKLLPFFDHCFQQLSAADQKAYARLLEADDWQIQDWLQGRSAPEEPPLARILDLIRRFGPT